MNYIDRIKYYIKKRNITDKQMLEELGYSKNLLLSWKKGSEPSLNKIMKIAEYLQVDFAYLITGENKYNMSEEDKKIIELLKQIPAQEKNKELARLELLVEQQEEKEFDKSKLSV